MVCCANLPALRAKFRYMAGIEVGCWPGPNPQPAPEFESCLFGERSRYHIDYARMGCVYLGITVYGYARRLVLLSVRHVPNATGNGRNGSPQVCRSDLCIHIDSG